MNHPQIFVGRRRVHINEITARDFRRVANAFANAGFPPLPAEAKRPEAPLVLPPPPEALEPRADGSYPVRALLQLCADIGGVSVIDIKSERRATEVMRPRQVFCWLAKKFTLSSFPQIGQATGGRDHTTALSSYRRVGLIAASIQAPEQDTPRAWAEALLAAKWERPAGRQRGPIQTERGQL